MQAELVSICVSVADILETVGGMEFRMVFKEGEVEKTDMIYRLDQSVVVSNVYF